MAGARDRRWLRRSFLLVFKSHFLLGSKDLGQVDGVGTARVWPPCFLGRVLGLGLAAFLPTKFFLELVASGPCLSPRHEPTACQERLQRSLR